MNFREKIVGWGELPQWRDTLRAKGKRLVVTNGCFDLLHPGHVAYLEAARALGDMLLVGVNEDGAVRDLKGAERPINPEQDRVAVVAALESVSAAVVFPGRTAVRFLKAVKPDVYVKGGDYTLETLNPKERAVIEAAGAKIVLLPLVPGKSTTSIAERLTSAKT